MHTNQFYTLTELKRKYKNQQRPIINNMIIGNKVSLITGGSKVGKTMFALSMAEAISKGTTFLKNETSKCQVLYISLDCESDLIGERINKMLFEDNDNFYFYFDYIILGSDDSIYDEDTTTLLELIQSFCETHSDLGVVFIDLFDDIRSITSKNEYSNIKVAQDINFLKGIADIFNISIILLNHDVKLGAGNGYNSSKGGVSLVGKINGSFFHLIRESIGSNYARMEIGGRNIPEQVINLELDTSTLTYYLSDCSDSVIDSNIGLVRNFIHKSGSFDGTISELCSRINLTISAGQLGRLLNKYEIELKEEGIVFSRDASHKNGRVIHICKTVDEGTEGTI